MKNTAIVLGYGVFVKPNPNYQKYLETALRAIKNNRCDQLIICGGFTSPKYPSLSEARSIKNFYEETAENLSQIIVEEKSLTTAQNLEFSKKYATGNVTVYCDSIRAPKIFYLCLSLYYRELTEEQKLTILSEISYSMNFTKSVTLEYQLLKVVGIPLSDTMEMAAHQIISSMVEMHFEDYPKLHQRFVDYRQKLWKIKDPET